MQRRGRRGCLPPGRRTTDGLLDAPGFRLRRMTAVILASAHAYLGARPTVTTWAQGFAALLPQELL
jgi:hypothetical protein